MRARRREYPPQPSLFPVHHHHRKAEARELQYFSITNLCLSLLTFLLPALSMGVINTSRFLKSELVYLCVRRHFSPRHVLLQLLLSSHPEGAPFPVSLPTLGGAASPSLIRFIQRVVAIFITYDVYGISIVHIDYSQHGY